MRQPPQIVAEAGKTLATTMPTMPTITIIIGSAHGKIKSISAYYFTPNGGWRCRCRFVAMPAPAVAAQCVNRRHLHDSVVTSQ